MAGTTAAALKSALKTAMAAEGGLSGVPISYGEPGDMARTEHVWIGAATDGDMEPASFRSSRKRRDETYTLDVVVEVSSIARAEASETRAVLLGTVIEEMLADDPKVGNVTNLLWCMVDGFELDTEETAEGPRSTYTLTLQARGRLL
jgi:hypothetical protein